MVLSRGGCGSKQRADRADIPLWIIYVPVLEVRPMSRDSVRGYSHAGKKAQSRFLLYFTSSSLTIITYKLFGRYEIDH